MKVIGQPENYSEMLERIFVCTLVTGFLCTIALALVLPEVKAFFDSVGTDSELGPIKGIKALYVAIPVVLALVSRIIKLHDRVSDLLGLRRIVDTRWILFPLAEGTSGLDNALRQALRVNRVPAMYETFYPHVTLPDSKIDKQLVRSALDNLGWLWSAVEATVIILLTSLILFARKSYWEGAVASLAAAGMAVVALALWYACRRTTTAEVSAILQAPDRRDAIRDYFVALTASGGAAGPAASPGTSPAPGQSQPAQASGAGASAALPTLDLFLSHASEDKDVIARPLFDALMARGVSVWFDEATLELGDSLRRKIDEGLARCRYGVVVLSPAFLAKEWPQRELDGLVARETASGEKAILPIWHNIDKKTLMKYSPPLADRLAASSADGVAVIVEKILRVLKRPA